ncbi:vesicle transport through interaction with t-SNAREs homolog 1B isoform 3-T3 [Rhinophrynus dorsalis]
MSSEQFEKVHELFEGLYGSLQGISQKLNNCYGEERKKLLREFDEKHQEANEMAHLQTQRVLLLQGTESLNRATDSITRSHRIAAETDAVGTDIIEELGEQREKLDRTKGRLLNTSENLSRSRKILQSMSRKIVTNKLLLSIVIALEFVILGGLIYYKFFRKI